MDSDQERLLESAPRAATGCAVEVMGDEVVVYDPASDHVHYLSDTAAVIWQLCDGRRTVDEIVELLREAYPDSSDKIPQDVKATVASMIESHLLAV